MKHRNLLLIIFAFVAISQLVVPAKMIFDKNEIMNKGKEFKFKIAPFDPSDPFRGKYITLYFDECKCTIRNKKDWNTNDQIYAHIVNGKDGFVRVSAISRRKPTGIDFLRVKISQVSKDLVYFDFPFEQFYIDQKTEKPATRIYQKSSTTNSSIAYAIVKIKDGNAALINVIVDGFSALEYAKKKKL